MSFNQGILRLTDANLNRAKEGLRVLEDVARFVLEDAALVEVARGMRHSLSKYYSQVEQQQQVAARDAAHDLGAGFGVPTRKSLRHIILANAHRAEEALRVLEEFSTQPDPLKDLRYGVYELEKNLLKASSLFPFMQGALYIITDSLITAREGLQQGASVLQLRDKNSALPEIKKKAFEFRALADEFNAVFIVNDYPEIAVEVLADGVHLGQSDMSVNDARKILKPFQIVGKSSHAIEQARTVVGDGCDYFAVGPIHATPTKAGKPAVTVSYLKEVLAENFKVPFVAIGGLDLSNVDEVLTLGARNVAIVRAIGDSAKIIQKINSSLIKTPSK
jgi:thiamine-phosphate pyrophosphorylase